MSQNLDKIDTLFAEFDKQLEIYQRLIDELSGMNANLKTLIKISKTSPCPENQSKKR